MKIYQVDSFTDRAFTGNPAGVCILTEPKDDKWMQSVATEMNLAETAFLIHKEDGYSLRWFTPKVEVDLCGHATLASAHILWEQGYFEKDKEARFHTRSGLLTAKLSNGWIELNFPLERAFPCDAPAGLEKALGIEGFKYIGKYRFAYLVEVESEKTVKDMKPDFNELLKVTNENVIVTSKSDTDEFDFVSRFFAPAIGIDEDPVTGSIHCCLAPYWMDRLNKDTFTACQASERGGILKVTVKDKRVILGGQAVTILNGEIL